MVEEGYPWPGTLVVASDSHTNMYGAIACLSTPIPGKASSAERVMALKKMTG